MSRAARQALRHENQMMPAGARRPIDGLPTPADGVLLFR